ncbi:MAG: hypothetical protein QUS09_08010 [Methanotrichaceae archaeon]|nr:hypothetical protein [Methanotrichaceae archaeon]
MNYKLLSEDEKDEIAASFLLAQERDHYCHTVNIARLREMLKDGLPEGVWKNHVQQLLADSEERLAQVESIIKSTALPSLERLQAAKARIEAKEAKLQSK